MSSICYFWCQHNISKHIMGTNIHVMSLFHILYGFSNIYYGFLYNDRNTILLILKSVYRNISSKWNNWAIIRKIIILITLIFGASIICCLLPSIFETSPIVIATHLWEYDKLGSRDKDSKEVYNMMLKKNLKKHRVN